MADPRLRDAAWVAQWDDGTNYLAVAPGVILGYDRNNATNTMLRKHGIEYRGYAQESVEILGQFAGVPVWNGLTGTWRRVAG